MESAAFLQLILVLVALLGVYGVALGLFKRGDPDRERFAKLRMSTFTGPNAGVVLSALAVSQLYYSLSSAVSFEKAGLGFVIAVGLVFIVVSLHRKGERLIELIGVVVFVVLAFVQDGIELGLFFVVVAVALLIALSILRFLFGK